MKAITQKYDNTVFQGNSYLLPTDAKKVYSLQKFMNLPGHPTQTDKYEISIINNNP